MSVLQAAETPWTRRVRRAIPCWRSEQWRQRTIRIINNIQQDGAWHFVTLTRNGVAAVAARGSAAESAGTILVLLSGWPGAGSVLNTRSGHGSQRVYWLALGYEDLNDHEQLRKDLLFGVLAGRDELDKPLAGKSTLDVDTTDLPLNRKQKGFMATTIITATCRCMSSAVNMSCAHGFDRPTAMLRQEAWPKSNESLIRYERHGRQ